MTFWIMTVSRMPIPLLDAPSLSGLTGIVAGCSTRHGGVSQPPFDTLNLGDHVGDDPDALAENRQRFCDALNMPLEALVTAEQVHGTDVCHVTAPHTLPSCDGLVTTTPGMLLAIAVADCAPVLLADPTVPVVGACHAGWRGAVNGIVDATLAEMTAAHGRPSRMYAHIGPCISRATFEVGPEVAARFDPAFVHAPSHADRPHVDVKAALRQQLQEAGVPDERISVSPHGTQSESDLLFSYRAAEGRTGRLFGAIGICEG